MTVITHHSSSFETNREEFESAITINSYVLLWSITEYFYGLKSYLDQKHWEKNSQRHYTTKHCTTSIQFVACVLWENLSNRSSVLQISCDICDLSRENVHYGLSVQTAKKKTLQPFEQLNHPFRKNLQFTKSMVSSQKIIRSMPAHVIRPWMAYTFINRYACPFKRLFHYTCQFSNGLSVHEKVKKKKKNFFLFPPPKKKKKKTQKKKTKNFFLSLS